MNCCILFLYFKPITILTGAFVFFQNYNTLYKNGRPLDNVLNWKAGIDGFFRWLQVNFPTGVILVAHSGGYHGDAKQIVRDFKVAGYSDSQIKGTVVGFVDTFVAFKSSFPGNFFATEVFSGRNEKLKPEFEYFLSSNCLSPAVKSSQSINFN